MTRRAAFALLTSFLLTLLSATAQEGETISNFDVRVEIDPGDASLFVTETITVNATGEKIEHGIDRSFPTLNKGQFGLRKPVGFNVISVLLDGGPEDHVVEGFQDGKRIRIGNKKRKLTPGSHTYVIDYRITGQLRTSSNYDELRWDATGTGWNLPISRAKVTVILPSGSEIVTGDDAGPAAYLGQPGTGENAEDYTYSQDQAATGIFQSGRTIFPGEGLTVYLPFSKGTVNHPDTNVSLLKTNWAYLLGCLLVIGAVAYHIAAWVSAGRDPGPGMIHTRHEPPENYSPAACRYLKRMRFDNRCFAAAVIGLAAKNALRITGSPDAGFVLRHPDSSLDKAQLTKDELALARELLHNRESLALEQSSHLQVRAARDILKSKLASLLEKTHFIHNLHLWVPGCLASLVGVALSLFNASMPAIAFAMAVFITIWTVACAWAISSTISAIQAGPRNAAIVQACAAVGFVAFWFPCFWMFSTSVSPATMVLLLVGAAVNVSFYHLIKAPTHAGRDVLDEIEGFEKFLTSTDLGSPSSSPSFSSFSRYLPYAIALDVEKQWESKFATALSSSASNPSSHRPSHPQWYSGSLHGSSFGSAIAAGLTSSLASASSSPSSSSSASSSSSSSSSGG